MGGYFHKVIENCWMSDCYIICLVILYNGYFSLVKIFMFYLCTSRLRMRISYSMTSQRSNFHIFKNFRKQSFHKKNMKISIAQKCPVIRHIDKFTHFVFAEQGKVKHYF